MLKPPFYFDNKKAADEHRVQIQQINFTLKLNLYTTKKAQKTVQRAR